MPVNVPLVDTFAPYRESIGNLTNALQAAPRMQMEQLQLGQAKRAVSEQARHDAENQQIVQAVSHLPDIKQRHQVAANLLESFGRFEEAQKIKNVDLEAIGALKDINPEEWARQVTHHYGMGDVEYTANKVTVGTQVPGTKKLPVTIGGKVQLTDLEKTTEDITKEEQAKLLGGRKTPEQLAQDAAQAGAVAGAQETAKQAARPDKTVERTVDLGNEIEYIYTDGTREKVKKGASPNTIIQVGAQGQQRDFKNETAMRQEFTKLPEVKTFQVIDSQMSRAQKAMEEATKPGARLLAVDQTLITVLNKMLDPSSVVRESEYARTPGDQALLDSIKGKIGKISSGGAGLTTPERKALSQMINNFYQIAKQQYDNQVDYYSDLAKRYGHDPENIVRLGGKKSTPSEVSPSGGLPPGIKVTRIK